eukprot:scaffold91969_cov15-Tisochrysis_lutea.AAC.1
MNLTAHHGVNALLLLAVEHPMRMLFCEDLGEGKEWATQTETGSVMKKRLFHFRLAKASLELLQNFKP